METIRNWFEKIINGLKEITPKNIYDDEVKNNHERMIHDNVYLYLFYDRVV